MPQPAAPAPRLPRLRQLPRTRGGRRLRRVDGLSVPSMVTVAVDAGGADLGPAEVAAGAAAAVRDDLSVILFGPADQIGPVPTGVEVVDAPVSIAKATDPAFAVRSTPEASIVQAAKAVADGRAQALVSAGSTGSALAAGAVQPAPRPRHLPPGAGADPAGPRRPPRAAARRRRQRHLPARAPGPVCPHGLRLRRGGDGHRSPAGGAAVQRRGAGQGHARAGRGPRAAGRRGRHRPELPGQHRGHPGHRQRGRRDRHGRLHRQHHPEADRGRLRRGPCGRSATPPWAPPAASSAAG